MAGKGQGLTPPLAGPQLTLQLSDAKFSAAGAEPPTPCPGESSCSERIGVYCPHWGSRVTASEVLDPTLSPLHQVCFL